MADYSNYYIKTHIGQHDFSKKGCDSYCKLSKEFCPFCRTQQGLYNKKIEITRWTDLADKNLDPILLRNQKDKKYNYSFNPYGKSSSSFNEQDQYSNDEKLYGIQNFNQEWLNNQKSNCGYSCWGDGSGFQYDIMSRDVIGPGQTLQQVYDITNYQINHSTLKLGQWNSWIEKFQYDYRFGRVSDTNAETILFPNVDNPWMFTEYVFKGIGKTGSKYCKSVIPDEYIVQPPLYNPIDLKLLNGETVIDDIYKDYDGKYAEYYKNEQSYTNDKNKNNKNARKVRQNRTIADWDDLRKFTKEQVAQILFSRTQVNEKESEVINQILEKLAYEDNISSSANIGVKLYRAKIPVQSVKWGQHGNIPPHTLDMTAPNDWMDPTKSVSKIRLVTEAYVGSPLYAPVNGVMKWEVVQAYSIVTGGIPTKKAQANIYECDEFVAQTTSDKKLRYKYDISNSFTEVKMPKKTVSGTEYIIAPTDYVIDDYGYCHNGCSFCKGVNKLLTCSYIENLNDENELISMQQYFIPKNCLSYENYGDYENKCPHYQKTTRQHPLIATYQFKTAASSFQAADGTVMAFKNLMAGAATGTMMGAMVGAATAMGVQAAYLDTLIAQYKNMSNRGDITTIYDTHYQIVEGTLQKAKLNKEKYNEYGKDVQILPDTGKYAFDSTENNVFSGWDTNVSGDINTRSFPIFFNSVMHCATRKDCNEIVGKNTQSDGYSMGKRAGGQGKCRYYVGGTGKKITCPYNGIPKRAYEFCKSALGIKDILLNLENRYFTLTKTAVLKIGPTEAKKLGFNVNNSNNDQIIDDYDSDKKKWLYFDNFAVIQRNDNIAVIAVKVSSQKDTSKDIVCSSEYFGIVLISASNQDTLDFFEQKKSLASGYMILGQFKTELKNFTYYKFKTVLNQDDNNESDDFQYMLKEQFELKYGEDFDVNTLYEFSSENFEAYMPTQSFYWYQPLKNDGSKISNNYGRGYGDIEEIEKEYGNEQEQEEDTDNYIPYNLRQHVNKNGYWFCRVDRYFSMPGSDCTIIDNEEKFIGGWHPEYKDYSQRGSQFIQDIEQDISREGQGMGDYVKNGDYTPIPNPVNKKGYWIDESGKYIVDEISTGIDQTIADESEREQPGGHGVCISFKKSNTQIDGQTGKRTSPKTVNGAVYSNDPYDLVCFNYKYDGYDEETGNPIPKSLDSKKPQFEQKDSDKKYYAPCRIQNGFLLPTMRKAIHCPKCDYYLTIKYIGIKKCPWCGSEFEFISGDVGAGLDQGKLWPEQANVIKKFFKLYALGNVDVWALPGTAIKTDAYFWKHQSNITNANKRQLILKLGKKGKNCYSFDGTTLTSELTLGYPDSVGSFKKVPSQKVIGKDKDKKDITNYDDTKLRYSKTYIEDWGATDLKYNDVKASYNPIMPRHMIPGLYNNSDAGNEDQGLIAPYTPYSNDALKILSLDQLRVLRNKIQPMSAYILDAYATDYPTYRASYYQRQSVNQPIIYHGRRATIPSMVLAATDDGSDSYQQYYSGDPTYGQVKEYFPSGYTWWYMKQVLGGRHTEHLGGHYHMDDKTSAGYGTMDGGARGFYTMGNDTIAFCSISLYGLLPLDKEIVKAYIIIGPSSVNPSKNPIGRSWNGGSIMYCHYHAFTQRHRSKQDPRYADNPAYYDGGIAHLHGTAGYQHGISFDENGDKQIDEKEASIVFMDNDIKYQDNSQYTFWGYDSNKIQDDRYCYYDMSKIKQMTENIALLYDVEFYRNVGTPKKEIKDMNNEKVIGTGYDENSFPTKKGFQIQNIGNTAEKNKQKFQYIVLDDDNNLVVKYPDSVIWKNKTTKQIQEKIDIYTTEVQFGISDGTEENTTSYTFTQTSHELYGQEVPEQSQGIPGYFDLSWANTKGYVSEYYKVDKKKYTEWNAPVIFQDEGDPVQPIYAGEVGGDSQNGTTQRIIDVTKQITNLYNKRIDRNFVCHAGKSLQQIKAWRFYSTLKTGGLDELDADVEKQNLQIIYDDYYDDYTLLSDSYSYPLLENINLIPTIDPQGEKYKLCNSYQILVTFLKDYPTETIQPFIITQKLNYKIKLDNQIIEGNLPYMESEYYGVDTDADYCINTFDKFKSLMKSVFPDADEYVDVDDKSVLIKYSKYVEIILCEFDQIFSINSGNISRIIEVTDNMPNYHPNNFLMDNSLGWRFNNFNKSIQSFTMDLLRAPLCKEQRGYRYEEGYIDYSNAKCPNVNCQAHKSGCAIAANLENKYFSGKSDVCPLCNSSLKGAEGVNTVAGDGIKTYIYDKPFDPNPFICEIIIIPEKDDELYAPKSVRIYVKSNQWSCWKCIAILAKDEGDEYQSKDIEYKKTYLINGATYNQESGTIKLENAKIRARFIKVEVNANEILEQQSYEIIEMDETSLVVKGDFSKFNSFNFQNIKATIGGEISQDDYGGGGGNYNDNYDNGYEEQNENKNKVTIISAYLIDKTKMRIFLNRIYPDEQFGDTGSVGSFINFKASKYTGGISTFKVYGIHYKTETGQNAQNDETSGNMFLIITDGFDDYQTYFDRRKTFYKLPFKPTYIDEVVVTAQSGYTLNLTLSKSKDDLLWTTQKIAIEDQNDNKNKKEKEKNQKYYYKITGGNYYYEPKNNTIYLPNRNKENISIVNFQENLIGSSLRDSYLPYSLSVIYIQGNGKQITLNATAQNNGPSYMLQKNTINIISSDSENYEDNFGEKSELTSCLLIDQYGNQKTSKIGWLCTNNKPSALSIEYQSKSYIGQGVNNYNAGEFRSPSFNGKEIHNLVNPTKAAKKFKESYGYAATNVFGKCETEITFTGPPNRVLSGTIIITAPAYTQYTYQIGNTYIKYQERTGGIQDGILICYCTPVLNEGGRATLCYQIPTLLVYAKERNPYSTESVST